MKLAGSKRSFPYIKAMTGLNRKPLVALLSKISFSYSSSKSESLAGVKIPTTTQLPSAQVLPGLIPASRAEKPLADQLPPPKALPKPQKFFPPSKETIELAEKKALPKVIQALQQIDQMDLNPSDQSAEMISLKKLISSIPLEERSEIVVAVLKKILPGDNLLKDKAEEVLNFFTSLCCQEFDSNQKLVETENAKMQGFYFLSTEDMNLYNYNFTQLKILLAVHLKLKIKSLSFKQRFNNLSNVFAFHKSIAKLEGHPDTKDSKDIMKGTNLDSLKFEYHQNGGKDQNVKSVLTQKINYWKPISIDTATCRAEMLLESQGICCLQLGYWGHYFEAVIYKDPAEESKTYITFLDRGACFWEGDGLHKTYQVDMNELESLLENIKKWRNLPARKDGGSKLKAEQTKTVKEALQEQLVEKKILKELCGKNEPVFFEFTKHIKPIKMGKCGYGNQKLGMRAVMHYFDFKMRRTRDIRASKLESKDVKKAYKAITLSDRFKRIAECLDHITATKHGETKVSNRLANKSDCTKIDILKGYKDKFVDCMRKQDWPESSEYRAMREDSFFKQLYDLEIIGKLEKRTIKSKLAKVLYEINHLMNLENLSDRRIQDYLAKSISFFSRAEKEKIIAAFIDKCLEQEDDLDLQDLSEHFYKICLFSLNTEKKQWSEDSLGKILVDQLIEKVVKKRGDDRQIQMAKQLLMNSLQNPGCIPSEASKKNTCFFLEKTLEEDLSCKETKLALSKLISSIPVAEREPIMRILVGRLIPEYEPGYYSVCSEFLKSMCCCKVSAEDYLRYDPEAVKLLRNILCTYPGSDKEHFYKMIATY